jgi:hypothetical protein
MVLLAAKTPYILAHAYVEDHSLAYQKWYEPVRSPWDSVPDNTVVTRPFFMLFIFFSSSTFSNILSISTVAISIVSLVSYRLE